MFEITKITESEQNDGTPKPIVGEGGKSIDFQEISNNISVKILLKDGTTEEQAHKLREEIEDRISGISIKQHDFQHEFKPEIID